MTRLRRLLQPVNWMYALGEITLIVVGVLIALAIDSWNDERLERRRQADSLREIRSALQTDLADIGWNLNFHRQAQRSEQIIRSHMDRKLPYADSLDKHFANALNAPFLVENNSAYETLKARGLDLITNDSLRAEIARFYDISYEAVDGFETAVIERQRDVLKPYYIAHFQDPGLGGTTPSNPAELLRDREHANLLAWSSILRGNITPLYEQVQRRASDLIADIDRGIQRLE